MGEGFIRCGMGIACSSLERELLLSLLLLHQRRFVTGGKVANMVSGLVWLVGWLVGCVVLQIAQAPAALGWVPEHWSSVCWKLSGSRLHSHLSLVFYRYLD